MSLRFLSIEHVPQEGLGSIESYIRETGALLKCRRLYQGQLFASHNDYDVLVVMGGPMGVYDVEKHAWLDLECLFVRAAIEHGKHVLGVCLGAQIIARALGAEVRRNPCAEIGWHPVRFEDAFLATAPGRGLQREMDVLHWHNDTFAMPAGAVRVAGSEACPNQGFLYGERVLGLQFHLEMGEREVRVMVEHFGHQLAPGPFVQGAGELGRRTAACAEPARRAMFSILDGWLGNRAGRRERPAEAGR